MLTDVFLLSCDLNKAIAMFRNRAGMSADHSVWAKASDIADELEMHLQDLEENKPNDSRG